MRIAIFGSGGVGGYYGARLAQAGHDVAFIARGRHLAAMREGGLHVASPMGDVHLERVEASADPADIGRVELVLVATKTYQIAEAAEQMVPLLGADTQVLSLLNGVEAPAQLAASLPRGRVLAGLTRIFSHIDGPGRIQHLGFEPYIGFGLASGAPADAAVERVLEALRGAGVGADIAADIEAALWRKFQLVICPGGVGAVTRAPIGIVRSQPESRALLRAAVEEVQAVAVARGIDLPSSVNGEAMATIDTMPAQGIVSMHRDLVDGRPSELDAWSGAVVRLGAEVGVATPVHGFITASLGPWERRARGEIEFV
jgi:2-dehydropantoate 2-reductase